MVRALGVGIALAILCRLGDHLLPEPYVDLVNLGGPWLVVAFVVGAGAHAKGHGALVGTVALLAAVGAYYGATYLVDEPLTDARTIPHLGMVAPWIVVALIGGPLFGVAGAVWRDHRAGLRVVGVALLSGALAGESAAFLLRGTGFATIVLVAELAVAVLLPWLLLQGRAGLRATMLAGGFALLALGAMVTLFAAFRALGP